MGSLFFFFFFNYCYLEIMLVLNDLEFLLGFIQRKM